MFVNYKISLHFNYCKIKTIYKKIQKYFDQTKILERLKGIVMEIQNQQTQIVKVSNDLDINEGHSISNQLIYQNFATKPTDSFLGISIQKQRLYVIQKKSIGVFQYFIGKNNQISTKGPIMIKEIFLPFQISKFYITEKYICVKSKNKTQIRDNEFQKVFYSENKGIITTRAKQQGQDVSNSKNFTYDTVEQLELECEIIGDEMISWKVLMKRKSTDQRYLRQYWSERFHILKNHKSVIKCKSQMIDPSVKNRKLEICKPPLFINQLGYIQNFYIWPTSSTDIQIGIFFNQKENKNVTQNALYEICSFQLKETNIKNIFYYDFKANHSNGKSKDGPHLFLSVCQNVSKENSKIKIVIFQILPEQSISHEENQNEALNNYLDQFNQLQKQKKSQQSLSNSLLLNQLLNSHQKSQSRSNPNKPTTIMESFTIKNSGSLKRVFFNPNSKVLWINDASDLVYRIKLAESGDIKSIRQNNLSFIQNLQGYQNGQVGPDLQGVMYDNFPIFKVKAYALEMGLRRQSSYLNLQTENNQEVQQFSDDLQHQVNIGEKQKEIIEFNDKQIQEIQEQKSMLQPVQNHNSSVNCQKKQLIEYQTQTNQDKKDLINQQTQTQTKISQVQPPKLQKGKQNKQISINNLSELLQQLNFNKVQDVLIRFSTIFTAQITKNVNKLKDFNQKAKDQIKLKINGQIFQLLQEVFSTLMNDALSDKIQKQVAKAKDFVQKIFNKQIQHFNLMILEEKVKQQNIKKYILQEQLRSMDTIKEASMKFLDVSKVREMQKIAYNQVVIQNIKEVGKQIQNLQKKVDEMFRQSEEMQIKIMSEVKEIKETFKLLVELEENDSEEEEEKKIEEEGQESGFESGQDEEESQEEVKQELQQKKHHSYHESYPYQQQRMPPPPPQFTQFTPGWNAHFYQGPAKIPYHNYTGMNGPVNNVPPHNYPPYYPSFPQSYHPQPNPYMNPVHPPQQQYFPPPNFVQHPFSETISGPKKSSEPVKGQKKKKSKTLSKLSSMFKNE